LDDQDDLSEDYNMEDLFQVNDHVIFLLDLPSLYFRNLSVEQNNYEIFFSCYWKFL